MKKLFLTLFFFQLLVTITEAQYRYPVHDFQFGMPIYKVEKSLYNKIEFIDSRPDVTDYGFVQRGEMQWKPNVFPSVHFSVQFSEILNNLVEQPAGDGQLMLQLKKFRFAVNGGHNQFGYFFFKADLYAKNNRQYKKLNTIDTLIYINTPEVTPTLFLTSSAVVVGFVKSILTSTPADTTTYTLDDILNQEKVENAVPEKSVTYKDGLYLNYSSFIKQVPDKTISVKLKEDYISAVSIVEENNKTVKVKPKEVYAVVYNGTVYIPTDLGYYPMLVK